MKKPRRAIKMDLFIEADSRKDLAIALCNLARSIEIGEIKGPSGASGGVDSGYTYEFSEDLRITNEQYFKEVNQWLFMQE